MGEGKVATLRHVTKGGTFHRPFPVPKRSLLMVNSVKVSKRLDGSPPPPIRCHCTSYGGLYQTT